MLRETPRLLERCLNLFSVIIHKLQVKSLQKEYIEHAVQVIHQLQQTLITEDYESFHYCFQ